MTGFVPVCIDTWNFGPKLIHVFPTFYEHFSLFKQFVSMYFWIQPVTDIVGTSKGCLVQQYIRMLDLFVSIEYLGFLKLQARKKVKKEIYRRCVHCLLKILDISLCILEWFIWLNQIHTVKSRYLELDGIIKIVEISDDSRYQTRQQIAHLHTHVRLNRGKILQKINMKWSGLPNHFRIFMVFKIPAFRISKFNCNSINFLYKMSLLMRLIYRFLSHVVKITCVKYLSIVVLALWTIYIFNFS